MMYWYDYALAITFAYLMLLLFFNVPIIGAILAWGLYETWMGYCYFRKDYEL